MTNSLSSTPMRKLRIIALPLVLSGFLTACLGGGGGGDTTTSTGTDTTPPTSEATTPPTTTTPPPTSTAPTPEPTQVQRSAVLLWNQPTKNTDGTLLTDLQGYKIYQGSATNNLKAVANVAVNQMNYTATGLAQGTYYFAVSAYNRDGAESPLSNVASKTFAY
jgi:hypothetical protein